LSVCFRKADESLLGVRLVNVGKFHVGSEASMLLCHELLYAEAHVKRSNALFSSPTAVHGGAPPPPPKARRGSSFPLQIYGTRMFKQQFLSNSSSSAATGTGTGPSNVRHRRMCSLVGTMDGALGCLVPVEERMYRRLSLLQQIIAMLLPSAFALNPRDFRVPRGTKDAVHRQQQQQQQHHQQHQQQESVVLDGCLLYRYLTLEHSVQEELAQVIGSSAQILRENLHELDIVMRFF
jgi:hypothetical protein